MNQSQDNSSRRAFLGRTAWHRRPGWRFPRSSPVARSGCRAGPPRAIGSPWRSSAPATRASTTSSRSSATTACRSSPSATSTARAPATGTARSAAASRPGGWSKNIMPKKRPSGNVPAAATPMPISAKSWAATTSTPSKSALPITGTRSWSSRHARPGRTSIARSRCR